MPLELGLLGEGDSLFLGIDILLLVDLYEVCQYYKG